MKRGIMLTLTFGSIEMILSSIVGLTYMDDYDFRERYRDVTECDPFHWYPLHLPEYCTKLYADAIVKGIRTSNPIRLVKKKERYDQLGNPSELLLQTLRQDVRENPSYPQLTDFPGLGTVALYKQEISTQSRNYIEQFAKLYSKSNYPYFYFPTSTESPSPTNTTENIPSS